MAIGRIKLVKDGCKDVLAGETSTVDRISLDCFKSINYQFSAQNGTDCKSLKVFVAKTDGPDMVEFSTYVMLGDPVSVVIRPIVSAGFLLLQVENKEVTDTKVSFIRTLSS